MMIGGMKWIGYSLSGVPTKTGVYPFKLRAEIEDTVPLIYVDVPYTITVLDGSNKPLALDSGILPAAKVAHLYSAQLKVSGGLGKKTFALIPEKSSTKLPAGLAISETGIVTCAPQATDSDLYQLFVRVTDESGGDAEALLPLHVKGLLKVFPEASTALRAEVGKRFQYTLSATGGFTNQFKYRWASKVPEGIELITNPDYTGTLCGTVEAEGSWLLAIEIDEDFSGSPVTTVVYYTLMAE
jgi:hypothetical protein